MLPPLLREVVALLGILGVEDDGNGIVGAVAGDNSIIYPSRKAPSAGGLDGDVESKPCTHVPYIIDYVGIEKRLPTISFLPINRSHGGCV